MIKDKMISIIIPVYNVEKCLRRCIESVINQTYSNIEIILVDDGSTDACPEICDEYEKTDDRIKVVHKSNGGLSDARNVGIDIAQGKYIGFVDSDDYIHPNMYEQLLCALVESESDISVCDVEKVYGLEYEIKDIKKINKKIYSKRNAVANLYDADLYLRSVIACGKLYKKELFQNIRYPVGKVHEDEFTTYKVFYGSKKVIYIDCKYYYYYQRSDSITGSKNFENALIALDAYKEMVDFYTQKKEYYLLQLAEYRYLCMLRMCAIQLKKSALFEENIKGGKLDTIFDEDCKKYLFKIKKFKRKIRLYLYYKFRIRI